MNQNRGGKRPKDLLEGYKEREKPAGKGVSE